MVPPPLAWVPSYAISMSNALGCSVWQRVSKTSVPLLYNVVFTFGDELEGKTMMQVWNLFQMYAAHNDCHPQGKLERAGKRLTVTIAVERRFGEPRNSHPAKK